jgi:hypothetical protein
MYENLGYDFVRHGQNRVFVGIEPSLHLRFFSAQCGDGALKILDFSLYIREANAVRFKSSEHRGECS